MDDAVAAQPQDAPSNPETLYIFCLLSTWIMLALNAYELFTGHQSPAHIASTGYFALLSAYAGHREAAKWNNPQLEADAPKRKGERFVYAWGLFLLAAWIATTYVPAFELGGFHVELHQPHELPAIVVEVIAVFFGTSVSGHYRRAAAKGASRASAPNDAPGEAPGESGEPGRTTPNWEASVASAKTFILDVALPNVGDEALAPEIANRVQAVDVSAEDWEIGKALRQLIKEGFLARISKGPRDPYTRYRRVK